MSEEAGIGESNQDFPELSSPQEKQQEIQPWVDKNRVDATTRIIADINESLQQGKSAGNYLRALLQTSPMLSRKIGDPLTRADEPFISAHTISSDSLNSVMGIEFRQPVFVVTRKEVYDKLDKAIFNSSVVPGHGVALSADFSDPDWQKARLVITTNNMGIAVHETRHAADPILRRGFNRMIDEMFAYYQQYILEGSHWSQFEQLVGHVNYFLQYRPFDQRKMDLWDFQAKVKTAVDGLKYCREQYGDVETQRKLVQMESFEELTSLSPVQHEPTKIK